MCGDLGLLTGDAGAGKSLGIAGHAVPDEPTAQITQKSVATSVSQVMAGGEDLGN